MTTKQALVPHLRFREFSETWKSSTLGDFVTIKSGYSPSKYELFDKGDIPFFKVEELNNSSKYQLNSRFYSKPSKSLLPKGAVIFPKRGAAILNNKIRIAGCDFHIDSNMMGLFVDKEITSNEFLFYFITMTKLSKIADTSTIPQLNNKHILPYRVHFPTLPEQEKIAAFLTSVDDRIDQLKRKKSLLQDYKKGVMQKLFSQELRFKDDNGKPYPDWEEKKLGEVIHALRSGLSANQNQQRKGYKVSRIETISNGNINLNKVGYVETDKDISTYKIEEGDMLFSNINSVKHIGKIAYAKSIPDLYHGMNLLLIRFGKNHNSLFFYHLLRSIPLKHYFERICNQAVSQASINQSDLKKTPLTFPSLPEQTKIANFLSTLDQKIEQIDTQITQTQTFKKGLLQQMFV